MSTLTDRPNTALIVIDVQNAVVAEAHDRDRIVGNIASLVSKARAAGVPVIWVQHNDEELVRGTGEWEYVPELEMAAGEPVVHKSYNDSFEDTNLEAHLGGLGVGHLVIAGAQTEWCVRSTLHGAIARGYDALLVSDAHTTGDMSEEIPATSVITMTNTYWKWHSAPGRTAGISTTAEVSFVS